MRNFANISAVYFISKTSLYLLFWIFILLSLVLSACSSSMLFVSHHTYTRTHTCIARMEVLHTSTIPRFKLRTFLNGAFHFGLSANANYYVRHQHHMHRYMGWMNLYTWSILNSSMKTFILIYPKGGRVSEKTTERERERGDNGILGWFRKC